MAALGVDSCCLPLNFQFCSPGKHEPIVPDLADQQAQTHIHPLLANHVHMRSFSSLVQDQDALDYLSAISLAISCSLSNPSAHLLSSSTMHASLKTPLVNANQDKCKQHSTPLLSIIIWSKLFIDTKQEQEKQNSWTKVRM
jgi:hypothetical protein